VSKLLNLSYKTLFIILILGLAGIVFFLKISSKTQKVSAAWWNDGWTYRVAVNIGNTNGSTLTNFQVPISIDTSALINSGKMQSNCNDIRITDTNGNLLNYWFSGCNTNSTKIWPKIPTIPNGSATIYIYYGNPSAPSFKTTVGTSNYPGLSCKSILDAGNSTGDGAYWIDPTNGDTSDKFQAYCDMTNDSGGWMLVTPSMINSEIGTSTTVVKTTDPNNGLIYTTTININGCSTVYSKFYLTDIIPWTKIKANYEFLGGNSCWSIFGNTGYSADTNLIPFSLGTDTIRNQVKMGGSNGDNYDGINSRCDNVTYNFWHSNQGVGTTRSAQVILRRNNMTSLAGLGTGASCVTSSYPWKYKNIYIREDAMTYAVSVNSPAAEEVGSAPVAYWKFDEGAGATAYDSTSNKFNGSITGATWQTEDQCISGKCLYFNGVGSTNKVDLGTSIKLNPANFSISAWIKADDASSNYGYIFSNDRDCCGTYNGFSLFIQGGKLIGKIWNSTATNITSNRNISSNQWTHVNFTYDGSSMKLYINGVLDNSVNYTGGVGSPGSFNASIGTMGVNQGYYTFKGFIDEVKLYPYARTPAQIKLDYNSHGSSQGSSSNLGVQSNTSPSLSSKLVAYWKFDEGQGTITNNSVNGGIGLSGILQTGTSIPTWSTSGKINKALNFLGNDNSYISVADSGTSSPLDLTNEFTISGWINIKTFNTYNSLLFKYIVYAFIPWGDGTLRFFADNGSWGEKIRSNSTIPTNQWTYIAVTYSVSNSKLRLYINGKLDKETAITTPITTNNNPLYIGRGFSGENGSMNGLIDEVKIYSTALTPQEILKDYNQKSTTTFGLTTQTLGGTSTSLTYCIPGDGSSCSNPLADWNFEENIGTTTKDISGNNITSTLTNTTWTTGKTGSGLNFDGATSNIGTSLSFSGLTAYTSEAWVKANHINGTGDHASYGFTVMAASPDPSNLPLWLSVLGSEIRTVNFSNSAQMTSGANITTGVWYHIAVTAVENGTVQVYVNGLLKGTFTAGSTDAIGNFTIGDLRPGRQINFDGAIDNVRVYNYVRTPAQIAYDFNRGQPIAQWKFDECQGSIVHDSSGNHNDGTITIGSNGSQNSLGTCQSGTSAAWINGASGKYNASISLDGNDDYISGVGTSSLTNITNGSISFWVYSKGRGTFAGNNQEAKFLFSSSRPQIYGTGQISIYWAGASNEYPGGVALPDNIWTHVVVIWQNAGSGTTNGNISIYYNGVIKKSISNLILPINTSSGFDIGGYGSSPLNGQMDDVRIYNYALTLEQIKQLYNNGAISFQ
jgi:hypothetical protein